MRASCERAAETSSGEERLLREAAAPRKATSEDEAMIGNGMEWRGEERGNREREGRCVGRAKEGWEVRNATLRIAPIDKSVTRCREPFAPRT